MLDKKLFLVAAVPSVILVVFIALLVVDEYVFDIDEDESGVSSSGSVVIIPVLLMAVVIPASYYVISKKIESGSKKTMEAVVKLLGKRPAARQSGKRTGDRDTLMKMLGGNERVVVGMLLESNGPILQSEITWSGKVNKVRTHRVVRDLERKGVIRLEQRGKTNRIFLDDAIRKLL